ncbi:MAG TPA: flavodoxin family protein [Syntrophorhabdaceae bacterium]|nr:flavodoxin family protein [Syntrophorhabdaceae bacterium]
MKAIGINGSPRKKWNTATLLENTLQGAASHGAETELVHLYDLNYKGCVSCFACKTRGGRSYGRCAVKDELTPILKKVDEVDIIVLASPIYFGTVTGEMRSCMERLFFPYSTYTDPPGSLFTRSIRTAFIYTLGATEEMAKERGFDKNIAANEMLAKRIFGASETLCAFDTYQFEDYSKVFAPRWDPEEKARSRSQVFPVDCRRAFEMGIRLAQG